MVKLRDYLHFNKMTASELARGLDLHANTVRYISSGVRFPSRKLAIKIEMITGGQVTRQELKPDFDWSKNERR